MGEYLKVTKVEVVSAVDLGELEKTLKWLVSRVQDLPTPEQGNQKTIADSLLQDQIDALRRENNSLKDALALLQSKQDDLESRLDTKQDRDQAEADGDAAAGSDAAAPGPNDSATGDLERRVAALEERMEQAASAPQATEDKAGAEAGADAAPGPQVPDLGLQLEELLAGHRALAATVSGLQNDLESKPNRGELDLKANRSELDALLRSGVSSPLVGEASGGGAAAPLEVAADGSLDSSALADAVNRAAADLAALRGQVAVMQDRIQAKAEQGGLDDLAGQVAALRARGGHSPVGFMSGLERAAAKGPEAAPPAASSGAPVASVLQALAPTLDGLTQRLDQLEVKLAAGGPSAAPSASGEDKRAVESIGSLADVQPLLRDIYARLDSKADRHALEDALRRLRDLTSALDAKPDAAAVQELLARAAAASRPAGSAAATPRMAAAGGLGGDQPQQQWIVSHELAEGAPSGALDELRAQVSALAARVADLASAPPSTAPTASNTPRPGSRSQEPSLNLSLKGRPSGGLDGADLAATLAALQGQLGELGTRLAGKADAGEVARLELALNGKADVEELAELRMALGGKADGAALGELQMTVAGKADQSALEEVKLTAALAADFAAAGGAGISGDAKSAADGNGDGAAGAAPTAAEGGGGGGGGFSNLLGAIQNMVADKAGKSELAALQAQVAAKASADDVALLRAALDDKAPAAELAALAAQLSGRGRAANSEEIASLDERMGDVFAELGRIRAELAALPATEALAAAAAAAANGALGGSGGGAERDGGGGAGAGGEATAALQRMVSSLSRDVGSLREGLDTVAHAANVLAVGLDGGARSSTTGIAGGGEKRYSENGLSGKENRSPRGGYERMVKLLGAGEYRHKMDAFDPTALQQMAQKMAYLEATLKSPAMGRIAAGAVSPGGVDYGMKELERQVKRLATDVRLMKDKVMDPTASQPLTGKFMAPGDHAMLAGRPITGYRCMACDRPLDQLDNAPGPHIPTQQLPARGPPVAVADAGGGFRPQVRSGRGDPLSPQASSQRLQYNNDPNVRGVQNWYKDTQGMAAEALPREHVGPHLPPGGWRPSHPGSAGKAPNSLPVLDGTRTRRQEAMANGSPVDGVPPNVTLPQIP